MTTLGKWMALPVAGVLLSSLVAFPATSGALEPSTLRMKVWGAEGGKSRVLSTVTVAGSLSPWRPGQRVRVFVHRDGRTLFSRSVPVVQGSGDWGTYRTRIRIERGTRYAVHARYYGVGGLDPLGPSRTTRQAWRVRYPGLGKGQCGRVVAGFRKALNRMAYLPDRARCFNGRMERAVLAYRKVNLLGRSSHAGPRVVKRAFNLKGRYRVRRPELGNHVEAPLGKQVIVFAKGKKPYAIFPIASGAPATPTILGTYSFYRKDPGYNAIGMYYSSYFIRGYAIHGYKSVPNYPASHGCLRTFIADQPRIYELTKIGMPIYLFGNAFRSWRSAPGLPDPAAFDRPS